MSVREALRQTKIRELKPSSPACVDRTATLAEAIASMRGTSTGCVMVCEGQRVTGILTERDLVDKIVGEPVAFSSAVEEFMTRNPKTLTADASLDEAIRLMDQGDYRHLPVVDGAGGIEGIISIQHIIGFLAELFPTEVLNLPPRQNQYIDSREGG
ncbi:MAG: CBS domain-containing protein [Blastocatellia bacterium]|nr:CBS domain-containing protein [Blastocatellia bacterium]